MTRIIESLVAFVVLFVVTAVLWGVVPTISEIDASLVDLIHILFILLDITALVFLALSVLSPSES
jgi:hypothetical protein